MFCIRAAFEHLDAGQGDVIAGLRADVLSERVRELLSLFLGSFDRVSHSIWSPEVLEISPLSSRRYYGDVGMDWMNGTL